MKTIFSLLVFPGLLFSSGMGMLLSYIDRKLTARIQYRKGPPFFQPFYDIVKLFNKELIVPRGASSAVFLIAPLAGLAGIIVASIILGNVVAIPSATFSGDIIVAMYMFTIPSLALIFGAFASANPLASLGASREIKLILAYELPFVLALLVPIIKSGGSIRFGEILSAQNMNGIFLYSWSGALAFLVCVLCIHAKLGLVPFDMAEAEAEIMGGTLIEYSGPALGIYKLTKITALFVMPFFLVVLFMGGVNMHWKTLLAGFAKILCIVVLFTLIRNTNPRVRIDQVFKIFWGPVAACAAISVVLALFGY